MPPITDHVRALLSNSLEEGAALLETLEKSASALMKLHNMRQAAEYVKSVYGAYPGLESFSIAVYEIGQNEMDFVVSDVVHEGDEDEDLADELVEVFGDFLQQDLDAPFVGWLNTDGDMSKLYELLSKPDPATGGRMLETTRELLQEKDTNALAAALFPDTWNAIVNTEGLDEKEKHPNLTLFVSTGNAGLAMVEITYPWLEKAEQMVRFSCENQVNISIPTYFWLDTDCSAPTSSYHEAVINPGAQWGPDTASIQFAAFENDEDPNRIMTAEIGLNELRQAFENGERELCVDFGTETLTVEDAMEVFGLVRDVDGALIPRTGAANLRDRMGERG